MNFKEITIGIEIKSQGRVISNSSALFFSNDDGKFLLSSKHSFCVNYDKCVDKKCSICIAPTEAASIGSDSIKFSAIEVNQSATKDIAIARIYTDANNTKIKVQEFSKLDSEYQVWKGGTEDRLILSAPFRAGSNVRFNIKSNINAHCEDKNFEVTGFSGSPIFIDRYGDEILIGILTDSCGINDVSCTIMDEDLISELEVYTTKPLFERKIRVDILDKSMEAPISIESSSVLLQKNALLTLIETSKNLAKEDPAYRDMIEEFQEFLSPRPGRKIIGLDNKLIEGSRTDLLEDAEYLENKFSRKVSRKQLSDKEQIVYFHCLSKINSYFKSYIKPLIVQQESNEKIDNEIQDKIISPLYEEILVVQPMSMEMIRGMLYFLTGKCHLRWK
ncbi:ABC-three component system protein [Photobacterium damselae]|uniref:ABC-three component system protein n=1 Tax=Photobacterium damselae TaxID=38293 RepID=UPI0040682408